MVKQIEHERFKRKIRKIYIGLGSFFYIYAVMAVLHFSAILRDNPRESMSGAFVKSLLNVFIHPLNMFPVAGSTLLNIFLISIGGLMGILMISSDIALRKHDNPDTVNGEAHLMTDEELRQHNIKRTDPIGEESFDGPNNMILSKYIRLAIDGDRTRRNCNILCIGGSGAGKSRFFAAPNILQYNANFVITDPSGELLNAYGKGLEDNGYRVRVFNLSDVYKGNRYNPFHYIKEEKDVFILVNTLIKNTTPPDEHAGDPFWEKSEKVLLSALILYLWHNYPEKQQTFDNVINLLNMAEVDENDAYNESPLDKMFHTLEKEDPDNLAVKQYKTFKLGAGKTLKSILISVGVRLEAFKLADIKYLTSVDEFEFETFADSKQALFVIIPTADTTFNFLVSLMYSQLFSSLYSYVEEKAEFGWQAYINKMNIVKVVQADSKKDSKQAKEQVEAFVSEIKKGTYIKFDEEKQLYNIYTKATNSLVAWRGTKEKAERYMEALKSIKIRPCERKCPNHVRLILDEFANIGQIPDFDQKLSTIRKYEISCAIILQAISQLKEIYEKKWNTIAANCDTKLFLGCDDEETITWLVKLLGKRTTIVQNTSYQDKGRGTTSFNHSSLELLTVDQVSMMADDECIVRIRGTRPHYGKKYELTEHPNYAYAHSKAGMFKIPYSETAKHERRVTPLWMRMKDNSKAKDAAKMAEGQVSSPSEPNTEKNPVQEKLESVSINPPVFSVQKTTSNIKSVKNSVRKENAKEKKEALDNFEENFSVEMDDMINRGIAASMGLSAESTDIEIKEAVESMIILENPPSDSFSYVMTE